MQIAPASLENTEYGYNQFKGAFDENPNAGLWSNCEAAEMMGQSVRALVEFTVSQPLARKANGDCAGRRSSLLLEPFVNSLTATKRHKKLKRFQ